MQISRRRNVQMGSLSGVWAVFLSDLRPTRRASGCRPRVLTLTVSATARVRLPGRRSLSRWTPMHSAPCYLGDASLLQLVGVM